MFKMNPTLKNVNYQFKSYAQKISFDWDGWLRVSAAFNFAVIFSTKTDVSQDFVQLTKEPFHVDREATSLKLSSS